MFENIKKKVLKSVERSEKPLKYYRYLKYARNSLGRKYLKARSLLLRTYRFRSTRPLNLYHASVQKTGSQWIKSVLSDTRIQQATGLRTFPQHGYSMGEFVHKIPRYTYVPGMYISYDLYRKIQKPPRYYTFYVLRDPRNIIVSLYYSLLNSHRLVTNNVKRHRKFLRNQDKEVGINYCIKVFQVRLSYIRSWIYFADDDTNVDFVYFEDITSEPVELFHQVLNNSGFEVGKRLIQRVLSDYTKEEMRKRKESSRAKLSSGYRKESTSWRSEFTRRNLQMFVKVNGNLASLMGYEESF